MKIRNMEEVENEIMKIKNPKISIDGERFDTDNEKIHQNDEKNFNTYLKSKKYKWAL